MDENMQLATMLKTKTLVVFAVKNLVLFVNLCKLLYLFNVAANSVF